MRIPFAGVALALAVLACGQGATRGGPGAGDAVAGAGAEPSLYERLGGVEVLRALVDELVIRVAADPRIQRYFVDVDIAPLKQRMVEKLCAATGGPCAYSGRTMREAHAGLGIDHADFEAHLVALEEALVELGVAEPERRELLEVVGGLRDDIVEAGGQRASRPW